MTAPHDFGRRTSAAGHATPSTGRVSTKRRVSAALAGAALLALGPAASAAPIDWSNVDWSVYALIDNSETVLGVNQIDRPRDIRGLEISQAGDYLYAGYNNPSTGFEVRRLDLSKSGNDAFVDRVAGLRGKAIATDDLGRVYLAEGNRIEIRSADLQTSLGTIGGLTKSEGVAVTREGGQLVMYASDRTQANVTKYLLTEGAGDTVTGHVVDATFGTGGMVSLGSNVRGVTVDAAGRIWVAGLGTDTLYRISPDGSTVTTTAVDDPFDVAVIEDAVLITMDLKVTVLDPTTLGVIEILDIVSASLGLDGGGGFSGIAVDPTSGFYVANEGGETLPLPDGTDDNDPILRAGFNFLSVPVPEPGMLALVAAGLLGLRIGRRASRRPVRAPLVDC